MFVTRGVIYEFIKLAQAFCFNINCFVSSGFLTMAEIAEGLSAYDKSDKSASEEV